MALRLLFSLTGTRGSHIGINRADSRADFSRSRIVPTVHDLSVSLMTEITDDNRRDLGPPRLSYDIRHRHQVRSCVLHLCPYLNHQSYVDGPQGAPITDTAAKKLATDEKRAPQRQGQGITIARIPRWY
jgi:hypothetical protein